MYVNRHTLYLWDVSESTRALPVDREQPCTDTFDVLWQLAAAVTGLRLIPFLPRMQKETLDGTGGPIP